MKPVIAAFILFLLLSACGSDQLPIPKPPTYLRLELPEHNYRTYNDPNCPYTFDIPELYTIKDVKEANTPTCHKDIDLGPLNGQVHFSYIDMTEPLSTYVNYANDKVGDHKLKATAINDEQILRPDDRVFGTFFALEGDVAAPFHFYLTDSTSRFVSGVVYFNSVPKYDSLKPSLDYLEVDLKKLMHTFQWKN